MSHCNKTARKILCAVLLLLCVTLLEVRQASGQKKTCHLVVIADTQDSRIGTSVGLDLWRIQSLFKQNVARDQLSVTPLSEENANRDTILRTVRRIDSDTEDTVIVYYAGHGGQDSRGQFITPKGRKVYRDELREALEDKGVRLGILITDTCSNYVRVRQAYGEAAEYEATETSAAFVALCWKPRGLVDLSATKPGEIAMGNNAIGGYFTSELAAYLKQNKDSELSWSNVARGVRREVDALFRSKHPDGVNGPNGRQNTQTVYERNSISGGGGGGLVFGVRARESSRGLVVTEVVDGSPASNITIVDSGVVGALEKGDIIVSINGSRIRTEREYARAIDNSPRDMRMTIINVRNGESIDVNVTLNK